MDSKAQQDNSKMQIQSPGTEIGRQHREAIRGNKLRRISLCVEIGFELLFLLMVDDERLRLCFFWRIVTFWKILYCKNLLPKLLNLKKLIIVYSVSL